MNINPGHAGIRLHAQEVLRLCDAAGTVVRCRHGSVWITQEQDTRDYIVKAGAALRLEGSGLTLVTGACAAEIDMTEAAPLAAWPQRLQHAVLSALLMIGGRIARRFGPEAISERRLAGWHGI